MTDKLDFAGALDDLESKIICGDIASAHRSNTGTYYQTVFTKKTTETIRIALTVLDKMQRGEVSNESMRDYNNVIENESWEYIPDNEQAQKRAVKAMAAQMIKEACDE